MGRRDAPDLCHAIDADTLVRELQEENPLQLLPGTLRSTKGLDTPITQEAWQLPIDVPPKYGRQHSRHLPIDLTPLFRLHDRHRQLLGDQIRWIYRYYYVETLAREGRIVPTFWVGRCQWPVVRGMHEVAQRACQAHGGEDGAWSRRWKYLLTSHVVQWKTPDNWLDLVALDEDIASPHTFVPESIRLRLLPVYVGVGPDDFRRCMLDDMLRVLIPVPNNRTEALARRREFAKRIGLPLRWPTEKARLLDQREDAVVRWVKEGFSPAEIAEKMVEEGLYPIRERDHDPWYDDECELRNAQRTAYRLMNELKRDGRITENDVSRQPRGRPRKKH